MKKSVVLCAAAAVLCTAAAGVSRFAVLPALDKVPTNLDVTVHYTGTAALLNAQALGTGDVAHAVTQGVPVTGLRHVHAVGSSGDALLVDDHTTLTAPGGKAIVDNDHHWSVSRSDLARPPVPRPGRRRPTRAWSPASRCTRPPTTTRSGTAARPRRPPRTTPAPPPSQATGPTCSAST
jgi:hypothetical protein